MAMSRVVAPVRRQHRGLAPDPASPESDTPDGLDRSRPDCGRLKRLSIAELARRFELDRKTVRRCLRDPAWRPYQRPAPAATLLTMHAEYLRARAQQVRYSAQILFPELRQQGYRGSYETVKRFVRPLRAAQLLAEGLGPALISPIFPARRMVALSGAPDLLVAS